MIFFVWLGLAAWFLWFVVCGFVWDGILGGIGDCAHGIFPPRPRDHFPGPGPTLNSRAEFDMAALCFVFSVSVCLLMFMFSAISEMWHAGRGLLSTLD